MTEKEKLVENLIEKTGKSKEELSLLINDKVNELSGLVSEEGAIYIVANELGVRLEAERPKKEVELVRIENIKEPKVPISLLIKVLKKYDKINFTSKKGNEGSVQSILAGDETGIIRITFWNDQTDLLENIHEGDILKIINAYTRENTQKPERIDVHYGQYSDIEVNPEGISIETPEFKPMGFDSTDKKISEIEEGDKNVRIEATITDFDIPRFYIACPNCFKKALQDEGVSKCAEHGEVEAIKVPIVNLIIDDASGTIPIVGFRDRAEKITGLSSENIISLTEDIDKYRDFSNKIIGAKTIIIGNVGTNSMTGETQIMLNNIELVEIDESKVRVEKENKKEEENKQENVVNEDVSDSIDDIEIEEIDLDDDLL